MTDQPIEMDRFVKYLLTAVVVTICADGLGVFLGTILNPVVSNLSKLKTISYYITFSLYFLEWNLCWRRLDVLYANVLGFPYFADSHTIIYEICSRSLATALCLREYGRLVVWQPT